MIRLQPARLANATFKLRLLPQSAIRLKSRNASGKIDPSARTPGFARKSSATRKSTGTRQDAGPPKPSLSKALQSSAADKNNTNQLLAPVRIPPDRHGILHANHPVNSILANSSIVVQRQLEMMNVLMGFEQANKYVIMDGEGNHLGYLAEEDHGFGTAMARQMFRTHRSFTTHVFDMKEREVLRFHRPFAWISSRIRVYDATRAHEETHTTPSSNLEGTSANSLMSQTLASASALSLSEMRVIGEAQQQWAPLRRKYNLFLHRDLNALAADSKTPQLTSGDLPLSNSTAVAVADPSKVEPGFAQFAYVDEPFLSWDFSLLISDNQPLGSVNRNFSGLAREVFTDTGVYALRMDSAHLAPELNDGKKPSPEHLGMTLDQRAVMLATAVSIDFDYFSRHSAAGGFGGGFMPLWLPWGGAGGAAGEAGAAEEAGTAAGVGGGAMDGAAGNAKDYGGAMAGAGTISGYEAMQRARGNGEAQQGDQSGLPSSSEQDQQSQDDDNDWWNGGGGGGSSGGDSGGSDGGGEGGGIDIGDFF
ncbi:MAG: hypothetical protein M1828_005045 [Chrysothrix sp. TS-e1954]|nr:MAG: hypothetical protein M1828_005045 [Chrysothrix sp. TS-e1954]